MKAILKTIADWAEMRSDIRAVFLASERSPVLGTQTPADICVQIYCLEPEALADPPTWLEALGNVWGWQVQRSLAGDPLVRALFEGGVFLVFDIRPATAFPRPAATVSSQRSVALLMKSPDAETSGDGSGGEAPEAVPREIRFRQSVQTFFFETCTAGRLLELGDAWGAAFYTRLAWLRLCEMDGWYAISGAFDLMSVGLGYSRQCGEMYNLITNAARVADPGAQYKALRQLICRYRDRAQKTALASGFEYPAGLDLHVTRWLEKLLVGDPINLHSGGCGIHVELMHE